MADYIADRQWSDTFIPQIKQIIGPHLLEISSIDIDKLQATDLVMLRAKNLMIACRLRRPGYSEKYPYQFTIRSHRDSGASTELEKVVNGFGDWMFYGHVADTQDCISRWFLLDLDAWRAHMIRNRKVIACGSKPNGDGTHFVWFDLRSFPPNPSILIASSHPVPRRVE